MQAIRLDIILPCYNPQKDWADNVIKMMNNIFIHIPSESIHLIIINDGSTKNITKENTQNIAKAVPNLLIKGYAKNKGKGYALRYGAQHAKGDYCIYTDIDFPYSVESFVSVYKSLLNGHEVVISTRKSEYYERTPFLRKVISGILKFIVSVFLRLPATDTQAGLKGFNKKGKACFLQTTINRYLFDLEFIYLAAQDPDIKIRSVQVDLRPDIRFSSMNPKILFAESINFLRITFRSKVKRNRR